MWDIDQLIKRNNEACLDWLMRGNRMAAAAEPKPQAWALSILADALKSKVGPPNLLKLADCFTEPDTAVQFSILIDEFLPEHKMEILSRPRSRRVYAFCHLFSNKYFELPGYAYEANMTHFVWGLPVDLLGLSYPSYHDLELEPGYLLLLSLIAYPFEGDDRDTEDDDIPFNPAYLDKKKDDWEPRKSDIDWVKNLVAQLDINGEWRAPMGMTFKKLDGRTLELTKAVNTEEVRDTVRMTLIIAKILGITVKVKVGKSAKEKAEDGPRVPLVDYAATRIGRRTANKIPHGGWAPEELHIMTAGTQYAGLADFAEWACGVTGCVQLDANYEHPNYEEGDADPTFCWSHYNVDLLAKQWPRVKEIRASMDRMVEWIEEDEVVHFSELLEFLKDQRLPKVERKERTYTDLMMGVHLQQVDQEGHGGFYPEGEIKEIEDERERRLYEDDDED